MMTTACFLVKIAGEAPFERLKAMPDVVEVLPAEDYSTAGEKLPLELRLKRQREIIRARRGELKRFLSPR